MLYAALCSLGYIAFISAWKTDSDEARIKAVLLMWAGYALATLSKGPHMPAMYLVASAVFCRLIGMSGREIMRLFHPLAGFILYAAITLPWWYLIQLKLGGYGLQGTQLSGSLLTMIRFDQLLNLYYFYRPLLLVLPWLVFLPHTILYYRHKHAQRDSNKLLALYILVPAFILSFGSQERWFYMLPSLPPMIILLATGADYMLEQRPEPLKTFRRLLCLILATGVIYAIAGHLQVGWSKERFEFHKLAQHALASVQAGTPIYTLNVSPDVYVYYLHTRISQENSMEAILEKLADTGHGQALVIMRTLAIDNIPNPIPHKVIYTTQGKRNKTLALVLLNSLP
jgi:4-amino-4-deoxy-L-arabinose transferase and related glycosyltransferases of PMT family